MQSKPQMSRVGPGELQQEDAGRRRFMQVVLGTGLVASAASFLYPILRYLVPPPAIDLGSNTVIAAKANELKANSAKIFKFGSKPGLLVRTATGEYKAMSATCTHLSCTVQFREDTRQVWCACHNGVYDLNGRNVSGPPPRPLEAYDVHVQGEDVVVSRKQGA
jgi:cytochrome b6-f complex iron-sulfur subunit